MNKQLQSEQILSSATHLKNFIKKYNFSETYSHKKMHNFPPTCQIEPIKACTANEKEASSKD